MDIAGLNIVNQYRVNDIVEITNIRQMVRVVSITYLDDYNGSVLLNDHFIEANKVIPHIEKYSDEEDDMSILCKILNEITLPVVDDVLYLSRFLTRTPLFVNKKLLSYLQEVDEIIYVKYGNMTS